jgi:hypothetical protein
MDELALLAVSIKLSVATRLIFIWSLCTLLCLLELLGMRLTVFQALSRLVVWRMCCNKIQRSSLVGARYNIGHVLEEEEEAVVCSKRRGASGRVHEGICVHIWIIVRRVVYPIQSLLIWLIWDRAKVDELQNTREGRRIVLGHLYLLRCALRETTS